MKGCWDGGCWSGDEAECLDHSTPIHSQTLKYDSGNVSGQKQKLGSYLINTFCTERSPCHRIHRAAVGIRPQTRGGPRLRWTASRLRRRKMKHRTHHIVS